MPKQTIINLILSLVLLMTCFALWRGRLPGHPPGQRGIAGTAMEKSEGLRRIQLAMLVVLAVACVVGLVRLN